MFRVVIPAILAVALTACGGGGGGVPTPPPTPSYITNVGSTTSQFVPSLVSGKFDASDAQYIIVSGWNPSSPTPPPVKIYKINLDGTTSDATVSVLGSQLDWGVQFPIVADFNNDGIDDIFFAGFIDQLGETVPSVAFLSRAGQSHQRVDVAGLTWSHGVVASDINNDGWIDVVNSHGHMWINNSGNSFTYHPRLGWFQIADPITGSGICAGQLDNSGTTHYVVTDYQNNGTLPIQDSWIFTIGADLRPVKAAVLPMPFFDRTSTTTEISHDVSCAIADFNNDGLNDVIVVSALNSLQAQQGTIPHQSKLQIYLNQGGLVFVDATDTAFPGWNNNILSSYTPRIFDFNGDGKPDIWIMNADWQNASANQAWINNGSAQFAQVKNTELSRMLTDFRSATNSNSSTLGIMLPLKFGGKWDFAFTADSGTRTSVGYVKSQWTFAP